MIAKDLLRGEAMSCSSVHSPQHRVQYFLFTKALIFPGVHNTKTHGLNEEQKIYVCIC